MNERKEMQETYERMDKPYRQMMASCIQMFLSTCTAICTSQASKAREEKQENER